LRVRRARPESCLAPSWLFVRDVWELFLAQRVVSTSAVLNLIPGSGGGICHKPLDSSCGICHKMPLMAMSGSARRSLLISVSITRRFDERDAEAIAHELRGVHEPRATRADLRSFMRIAIQRALVQARERLEERASDEERPSVDLEGGRR
jgi:hypothetical protein